MSDRPTFSDFEGVDNENVSEIRKGFDETLPSSVVDAHPSTFSIDHSQASLKSIYSSRIPPLSKTGNSAWRSGVIEQPEKRALM